MSREAASKTSAVISRGGGESSTPRLIDWSRPSRSTGSPAFAG